MKQVRRLLLGNTSPVPELAPAEELQAAGFGFYTAGILEGLAERLGIAGRVTWFGALPRKRVDEVWPLLDCVVLP